MIYNDMVQTLDSGENEENFIRDEFLEAYEQYRIKGKKKGGAGSDANSHVSSNRSVRSVRSETGVVDT